MTVIDVHTHMVSTGWLDLLVRRSGTYTLQDVPGGARAIHRAGAPFMTLTPEMFDYEARLQAMDEAGVDLAIVSLTCPNVFWGDADTSLEAARLINEDMAAAQESYPGRIRWLCSLPWEHPDKAVAELDRALDAGAAGVMVLANIDGAPLTHERFAPVWKAIDERALPVFVHPTTPPGVESMSMDKHHLVWSLGFTFDTTLALSRMVLAGFFDRYAHLKVLGAHAGGYLPFITGRLDAGFRSFPAVRECIDVPPSSYLDRIHVDSIAYAPEALRLTVDVFGRDHVLYGSDYPHKNGRMEEILAIVGSLGPAERERVYSENASALFGL